MRLRLLPVLLAALLALVLGGCAPAGSDTPLPSPPPSATPEPEPSPSPSPSPPPFEPRTVSINVSGDLLWHNSTWISAQYDAEEPGTMDFFPQLASLQRYVSAADVAVCHAEVPFAPEGGPYQNYPLFAAPPEIAAAVATVGWDVCTTASNHTMDQGFEGLARTIDVHEQAGIQTVGSYRTEEEALTPAIYETEAGVKVGFVSQTFSLNGLRRPTDKPWAVRLLDAEEAIEQAATLKEAGADLVAVHMHAGTEYSRQVDAQQRDFAEAVTASPHVDFVFGQHPHVVQPIDIVNDTWVVYSTGNLIAASGPAKPYTYDGFLATVVFEEREDGTFQATGLEWVPTMITEYGRGRPIRVYVIPDELENHPELAARMRESAERTRAVVTSKDPEGLTEVGQP